MNIKRVLCHLVFVAAFLSLWELMAQQGLLDPLFFGRPLGIATYLRDGFFVNWRLWRELGYTVAGASISFTLGSLGAVALGMLFVAAPRLERTVEPYLLVLNAMPRIALVPLFLLWFGLGRVQDRGRVQPDFFHRVIEHRGRHPEREPGPSHPFAYAGRHSEAALLQGNAALRGAGDVFRT